MLKPKTKLKFKVKKEKPFVFKKKQRFSYKREVKVIKLWAKRFLVWKKKKIVKLTDLTWHKSSITKVVKKKYFVWKKKKKRKSIRHLHNFVFFFRKRKKRYARLSRSWLFFQLKFLKKTPMELESQFNETYFPDFKTRFPSRLKKRVLKKRAFILRLLNYYLLDNKKKVFALRKVLKKKKKKVLNFFFFLEFRIASVCLRMHFFWNMSRAYFWVRSGSIALNNIQIINVNTVVKVNDFLKVIGPKKIWELKLMTVNGLQYFHTKMFYTLNHIELSYIQWSGIVLKIPLQVKEIKYLLKKKRKTWLKLKFFSYLTNSFY